MARKREGYTTDYAPTALAIADEIAGTGRDFAADQVPCLAEYMPLSKFWSAYAGPVIIIMCFVGAAKSLLYQPMSVLEQIETDLVTGQRERVKGIEISVAS